MHLNHKNQWIGNHLVILYNLYI